MRIKSIDLPQADKIESVVTATVAIANGARSDIEIANAVPGIEGDDRQGRYYRRAAINLGFVTNRSNYAEITEKGLEIAKNPILTNPTLVSSVLSLNLYQKLIPFLEIHSEGLSRQQILDYLQSIAVENIGPTMIPRRISTILAWIRTLRFIEKRGDLFYLSNAIIPRFPVMNIKDIEQPLLPTTGDLREYEIVQARVRGATDIITMYKDLARQERANTAHLKLVNLVASRIREAGSIPKSNILVDLAVNIDTDFIFEMKSSTDRNVRSQIRRGLSQLYEYRYLQNKPEASLVLVIENPLNEKSSWMLDFLENDRDVLMIWDGDDELHGSQTAKRKLPFLYLR